jgi:hypothetical protein
MKRGWEETTSADVVQLLMADAVNAVSNPPARRISPEACLFHTLFSPCLRTLFHHGRWWRLEDARPRRRWR